MYIIVVGGGKIGYYLSRTLLSEGHEVLILEKDPARCGAICEELGSIVTRGDGCEARTLAEVGTERADMFIAVTDEDEDNISSMYLAPLPVSITLRMRRSSRSWASMLQ